MVERVVILGAQKVLLTYGQSHPEALTIQASQANIPPGPAAIQRTCSWWRPDVFGDAPSLLSFYLFLFQSIAVHISSHHFVS